MPDDIAALPDAQGYGKMRDLHQAMAVDATGELKTLIHAANDAVFETRRARGERY